MSVVKLLFCALLLQGALGDLIVPINDYSTLLQAIERGQPLHNRVHYKSCLLDGGPSVNASGGYEIEDISVDSEGTIHCSATKLIYNYQGEFGKSQGSHYVFDHVTTRVYSNGTVFLTASDLTAPDPNSGPPFYTETFTCKLGSGITFYSNVASELNNISSYDDLLHCLQSGGEVTFVETSQKSIFRSIINTFEAFGDPPRFGPRYFAWGTEKLDMDKKSTKWVKQSRTMRVYANGTVVTSVVGLDPATLETIQSSEETVSSFIGGSSLFVSWNRATEESNEILRFRTFIAGHFSNSKQVAMEIKNNGTAIHPLAVHISDVATQKFDNLPEGFGKDGRFFFLEETYATQEGKPPVAKPMLFLFAPNVRGQVTITSYDLPTTIPVSDLRNNNTKLRFDYNTLIIFSTFNKAMYTYDASIDLFHLGPAVTPIKGGEFILTSQISANVQREMEDVIQNGKSVMPYHTPIMYERI